MERNNQKSGWAIYRRLVNIALKNNSKWLMFAVIGMLITAASDPALSAIMKPILDGAFIDKDPEVIRLVPLGLFSIFLLRSLGIFLTIYFMAKVGRSLVARLREMMFTKLLTLPVKYYDKTSSGDLMSRISHNVELLSSTASRSLIILIRDTLTIIGLLSWMFYLNWILTICFLIAAPFITILVGTLNKRFRNLTHKTQKTVGGIINVSQEVIHGNKIVKIFGGYKNESDRFQETNYNNQKSHLKLAFTEGVNSALIMLIVGSSLSGIILISTFDLIINTITVGTFVSFMFAMLMILGPARGLASINARLQQGVAAGENVFQLIDEYSENDTGKINQIDNNGAISFINVNFSYNNKPEKVLQNINLDINPNMTLAIVGKSGCGKSTLVNLIPRFYSITEGEISIGSANINDISLNTLRKHISYVGQNTILFNDTIFNNITYGENTVSKDIVEKALKESFCDEFVYKLDEGVDTLIGENGVLLSGGQRQRLAIARAFIKDSQILIFEEATSSLDSLSEKYIQNALENLKMKKTTIIIAHRLSTVESADRIIVLNEGKIVESGTHNSLLEANGTYYELYNSQLFK